ncbi:MAG: hypothetical protein EBR10_06360 [Planctomycetes bacterium]|nr:hypothetical protein [Planctomycetota bacterium]
MIIRTPLIAVAASASIALLAPVSVSAQVQDRVPAADPAPSVDALPKTARVVDREASADGVRARWTLPTDLVQVGDAIPFRLTVYAPDGISIEFPELGSTSGVFDIRDIERQSRASGSDREWTLSLTASTFDAGVQQLPAFQLSWKNPSGEVRSLEVGDCTLNVTSIAGDAKPEAFKDIKGPLEMDLGGVPRWVVAILAVVGALVLFLLAMWLIRKRHAAALERAMTPDAWALRELAALEKADLVGKGEYHAYWVRLSAIIRQYVERRFDIAAPEKTTQEFLAAAREHPEVGAEHRHVLTDFLRAADMVKFAALQPADDECRRGLFAARDFVQDTTATAADRPSPQEVRA